MTGHAAQALQLYSNTIQNNTFMSSEQANNRCGGDNISPDLRWTNAPQGTKSFALIVHDPDSMNEYGFYHWIVTNIAATVTGIAKGARFPAPAREQVTNFGMPGYNGPCPPVGHGAHHYYFTLYALNVASLDLAPGLAPHQIEAVVRANSIGQATITGLYQRN